MSDIDQLEHLAAKQKKADEMIAKLSAPLNIEDVQFMASKQLNDNECLVLAYKNARIDMRRLDEAVGHANWQREHKCVDGHWFCKVGVRIGGEWIWKEDAGSESNFEAEKGAASDSFKRACTNWGIGRELYDYPTIKVQGKAKNIYPQYWKWDAGYDDDGKIKWLRGMDGPKEMFTWPHDNLPVNVYQHNDTVRENWDDVHAIKEAIANEDWPTVVEYSDGMEAKVKHNLWLATTKGGLFTTAERNALHGNDVSRARNELNGKPTEELVENE
jgi:hypothetical protein